MRPFGCRLPLPLLSQNFNMPDGLGYRGFEVGKIDRLGQEIERVALSPDLFGTRILMQDFISDYPFKMGKGIGHMRQLHGFHELLLEVLFHRQLDVFHVPGTPVASTPFDG